jgi:MraZ protein
MGIRALSTVFRGATKITLDAKGRLAFPARFRERLAARCDGKLVCTVDPDYCLLIYPLPEWEEIERKLMRLPSLNRKSRRLQRLMVGHASELEIDSHGRVLIPRELREFASLDRQAILFGQGNKFELWDEARWNETRASWLAEGQGEGNGNGDDGLALPADLEQLSF